MNIKCYPVKLYPRIVFILKRILVRQNIFTVELQLEVEVVGSQTSMSS